MATSRWRIARCRRWQAVYDAQVDALLFGDLGAPAGHICEQDSHRWQHKADDCTRQEVRLDRLLCRARDRLLLLQKLRRNNQIAGAVEREPIFWPDQSPADDAVRPPESGGLGGNEDASPFADGEIQKNSERTEIPILDQSHPQPEQQGARQRAPTRSPPCGRSEGFPRNV
jgi:hypothetical protein